MADPRNNLIQPTVNPAGSQQRRSEFFRNVGKVGDLEVLNNIDNDVGQGLRSLETISNQIRTGVGVPDIWTSSDTSAEAGEDAVLDATGVDPRVARGQAASFSPDVANRAFGQANAIYERVQQGNFEIRDFPEALQDIGNLGQLIRGIYQPAQSETSQREVCPPSQYAQDLIAYAPKHKYMFVVEFVFKRPHQGTFQNLEFAFVVKRTTRPQIQFEYEEVNYYNFKTKVPKRSEYQPMTMTFYDDMRSNVLQFYNNYLRIISPISRIEVANGPPDALLEESGMPFNANGTNNDIYSASIRNVDVSAPTLDPEGVVNLDGGEFVESTTTILDHIRVFHLAEGGKFTDEYFFKSPKILDMQLDDLDMVDGGTGGEMTITFSFDALGITPRLDTQILSTTLSNLTDAGERFPLEPRFDTPAPSTAEG